MDVLWMFAYVYDLMIAHVCLLCLRPSAASLHDLFELHAHAASLPTKSLPAKIRRLSTQLHLYTWARPSRFQHLFLGWGLPTLGCLCKDLPNIEQVPRPTGVWQKDMLKLTAWVFRDVVQDVEVQNVTFKTPHPYEYELWV